MTKQGTVGPHRAGPPLLGQNNRLLGGFGIHDGKYATIGYLPRGCTTTETLSGVYA